MEMEHGNLLDEMGTDSTMMVAIGGEGWWGRYCKVQIVSIESSLRQSKKKGGGSVLIIFIRSAPPDPHRRKRDP